MCEDTEFFKMLKRMIRAGAKRAADADEHELVAFSDLSKFMESEFKGVIQEQVKKGKSWADIGDALNISRQAAHKRFSK